MSSSAHITDAPGTTGIRRREWDQFCADHGLIPRSPADNTWYSGQVEVNRFSRHHVSFSTYRLGEAMPDVVKLAVACWLRFGGYLSMDDELRNILAFKAAQGAARQVAETAGKDSG